MIESIIEWYSRLKQDVSEFVTPEDMISLEGTEKNINDVTMLNVLNYNFERC